MKAKRLCVAVVAAAAALGAVRVLGGDGYRNPIIWADVPDPSICFDGENYYMVSTTMHTMPGGPIMRSRDLRRWETVAYLFDRLDEGTKYSLMDKDGETIYGQGQWATSLRYHNGKFYAWFVCNGQRAYIFTADKAEGPWRLLSRPDYRHDGSLFFDDDGRVYVFHGSGNVSELREDLSDFKPGGLERQLFVRDADEQGLLEGSSAFKKDGWYYLMMISMDWSIPGRLRREVCYRSRSLTGEWEKKVILETNFGGWGGVGQGCVVEGPDGEWNAMIFQDRGGVGRVPCLMPVRWVDGWPMLGDEKGDVPSDESRPYEDASGWVGSDDFEGGELKLYWEWNHNPSDVGWSLVARPGRLRLINVRTSPNIFLAPNTLTQRMAGPACAGAVKLDVSGLKDGDVAGLAAFQSDSAVVAVKSEGGIKRLVMSEMKSVFRPHTRRVTGAEEIEHESVALKGDIVWVRIRADFRRGQDWAEADWSEDGVTWRRLGVRVPLRYDCGRFFTGTKFALFNYATKSIGGYADFDDFTYVREECE